MSQAAYHLQFPKQRGPSYAVMTGAPAYNSAGAQLPHELHWCYRANSCEIVFDAADRRYIDLMTRLAEKAPDFLLGGFCLSGCFSKPPHIGVGLRRQLRNVLCASNKFIGCRVCGQFQASI